MLVVDEKRLSRGGVRVAVMMRRVAVGISGKGSRRVRTGSGDQEQEGVV